MVKTLTKKQLEIVLSKLKENPTPVAELEQYTIPGEIAAQIINLACLSGDIEDKNVVDFACGTGRLAIGATLMNAKKVVGADIDENIIRIAKENVRIAEMLTGQKIRNKLKFRRENVSEWREKVDTIVQNPPFGIQKLHADRLFLERALKYGNRVYSLHRGSYKKTDEFLKKFVKDNGGKVEKIIKFKFRIPYMFKFHKKPYVSYDVDLLIISKV